MCVLGGATPTLPCYIWPANKPAVILDSTHGENTHTHSSVCDFIHAADSVCRGDTPSSRFIKRAQTAETLIVCCGQKLEAV